MKFLKPHTGPAAQTHIGDMVKTMTIYWIAKFGRESIRFMVFSVCKFPVTKPSFLRIHGNQATWGDTLHHEAQLLVVYQTPHYSR